MLSVILRSKALHMMVNLCKKERFGKITSVTGIFFPYKAIHLWPGFSQVKI